MGKEAGDNALKIFTLRMIPSLKDLCTLNDNFMIAETDGGFDYGSLDRYEEIASIFKEPLRVEFASCLIVRRGWLKFRLNMKEYALNQNDAGIVMPGDFSQCLEISDDCALIFVAFSDDSYIPIANGQQLGTVTGFFRKNPVVHFDDEKLEDIVYIFDIMRRRILNSECRDKETIVRGYFHALLQESIAEIAVSGGADSGARQSRGEEILAAFMELLKENYLAERSVVFYADRLCLTPKHLSSVVKSLSGRSVSDWIREYVLLETKVMLQTHKYSVQEISDRLNFVNQSFFGTWFKKATGLSPRRYMEKFR